MAGRWTDDGKIDKRFKDKPASAGCFFYLGLLILLAAGAVFVISTMGYTEQFVGNIEYLYESGWLEIGGYTLLGIFLLLIIWVVFKYKSVAKEMNDNAEKNEKEESVNDSSNTSMLLLMFMLSMISGIE